MSIWNDVLGCETHYVGKRYKTRIIEHGTGRPLLLLHGIGGHAEAYSRNIRRLGQQRRVIAIDLLWHGMSGKPPVGDDPLVGYLDQLTDLIDDLSLTDVSIEGESLGGRIAIWFILQNPGVVQNLILNTSGHVRFDDAPAEDRPETGVKLLAERSLAAIRDPSEERIRQRLEWLMASPERVTDELVDLRRALYSDASTRKALTALFETAFAHPEGDGGMVPQSRLRELTLPVLALWSDKNPGRGPDIGRKIARLVPDGYFYCIDDAAHWPQWEKPEEHDRVVTSFLNGDVSDFRLDDSTGKTAEMTYR
jgi:pimeloyl-ACP methyl ester carboxylesterase